MLQRSGKLNSGTGNLVKKLGELVAEHKLVGGMGKIGSGIRGKG
jgi:hypothetical protein